MGSELWGRHLSLILIVVAVVWVLVSKKEAIDNVAQHTMHHT